MTATRFEWGLLLPILYLAVPTLALFFFAATLTLYLTARRKNKKIPGSVSAVSLKNRKLWLIVSSIVLGVMLLVVLGFMGLLLLSVAFM